MLYPGCHIGMNRSAGFQGRKVLTAENVLHFRLCRQYELLLKTDYSVGLSDLYFPYRKCHKAHVDKLPHVNWTAPRTLPIP